MRGIMVAAGLAAAAFVGWVLLGQRGGTAGGSVGDLKGPAGQAADQGKAWWADLAHQPWFYTAAAAGVLGVLGVMTWNRIGNWGRMLAMLLLGVGVAIFLVKVGS